jgi:alpha-galactosidase
MFNWGSKTHSFDATNKGFLQHVDTLFRYITHQWGYRYLKLDFNVEPSANRADRSVTPMQALRNFYKVIKNAVGDSVFIANCAGAPFPPCIGIAKAGRVGPDVNPNWTSVLVGCRSSILHIPFHHRWWTNDPDCLNLREKRSQLTEDELRTHITANFMGGGYVLFSDSIEELTPQRKMMLAQALPPAGNSAEIADYMTAPESGIPSLFYYPVNSFNSKSSIVTLFNWGEKLQSRKINMTEVGLEKDKDYYVYDFWADTYKGIHRNEIAVDNQKAHACTVMAVRPVEKGQIQVISTSLHLLQGKKEITGMTRMVTAPFDGAKAEMWLEITPVSLREGKVILASPEGVHIAAAQGAKASLSKRADGLWDLNLSNMTDKVAVLLRVR